MFLSGIGFNKEEILFGFDSVDFTESKCSGKYVFGKNVRETSKDSIQKLVRLRMKGFARRNRI